MRSHLPSEPLRPYQSYLLALLFFAPALVLFAMLVGHATESFYPIGDNACIESRVLTASQSVQYVGTWSRFGWNNPGPLYFYMLVPFYLLSSMGTQSLHAGALFLNIVSVLIVLWCLLRTGNSRLFFFAAFFLSLYAQHYLGLRFLRGVWDPYVTVLPFAAFTLISVHLSLGNPRILPLAAGLFTFLVQTRVGYLPVSTWVLAVSLLLCGTRHAGGLRGFVTSREFSRPMAIAAALLAVLWALPVVEAVRNPPGNLGELLRFFLLPSQEGQTVAHSFELVARVTNQPLVRLLNQLAPGAGVAVGTRNLSLFCVQVVLGVAALLTSRAAGQRYGFNLLLVSLSSLVICLVSVSQIPGNINVYLINWMSILGLIHWSAIGWLFGAGIAKSMTRVAERWKIRGLPVLRAAMRQRSLAALSVLLLSAALFIDQLEAVADAASFETSKVHEFVGDISRAIEAYVERENIQGVLIKPNIIDKPTQAAVFNQLYKASVPFHVEDEWLHWVGHQFKQTRELGETLVFTSVNLGPPARRSLIYGSVERSFFVYRKKKPPGR